MNVINRYCINKGRKINDNLFPKKKNSCNVIQCTQYLYNVVMLLYQRANLVVMKKEIFN